MVIVFGKTSSMSSRDKIIEIVRIVLKRTRIPNHEITEPKWLRFSFALRRMVIDFGVSFFLTFCWCNALERGCYEEKKN
jgi:hypothetical protein